MIKFEAMRINFLGNVFVAVAVLLLKLPNDVGSPARTT